MAEDLVQFCPHCGSYRIREREGADNIYIGNQDEPWACDECKKSFTEPDERPRKPKYSEGGRAPSVDEDLIERVRKKTDL